MRICDVFVRKESYPFQRNSRDDEGSKTLEEFRLS